MVYFTSDLHLGHLSIPKYREPFVDMKSHDEYILNKIEKLGKRDILIILGDFLFDGKHYDEYAERLRKVQCRLKLVMGNHDSLKLYKEDFVEIQLPLFSYKNYWLSHCPIHPHELRNRNGCLHGHLHKEKVLTNKYEYIETDEVYDSRYFNVNLDVNNYEFVLFEDIKKHFENTEKE